MSRPSRTLAIKLQRTIPATKDVVFDAWLNSKVPGTPWKMAGQLILNPEVDGLFYWKVRDIGHYGRFTEIKRPEKIQYTWVSPNTLGEESLVTVTFSDQGDETLLTLVHSDLPEVEVAKSHESGWGYFLGLLAEQFEGPRSN